MYLTNEFETSRNRFDGLDTGNSKLALCFLKETFDLLPAVKIDATPALSVPITKGNLTWFFPNHRCDKNVESYDSAGDSCFSVALAELT